MAREEVFAPVPGGPAHAFRGETRPPPPAATTPPPAIVIVKPGSETLENEKAGEWDEWDDSVERFRDILPRRLRAKFVW